MRKGKVNYIIGQEASSLVLSSCLTNSDGMGSGER